MKDDGGRKQREAVARLIGWQLYGVTDASHIELDQWEKCVHWALNDKRPKTKPYVPDRVCIPFARYNKICNGKGVE
jgi:hypothetical protein